MSEERMRLAVRASNTGLWDWDIQTGDVYFSPEWKAQLGFADHEIENRFKEWEERLHPDDWERTLSTVKAYLEKPWPNYEVEFRMRHRDGTYRWILARGTLVTDEKGKAQRMLGSHLDITERKQTEEASRTIERLYRILAHNFPNGGVALFDRDLRYLIADGAEMERVGLSKEIIEGRTIWDAFSPEVSRLLEPVYRAALAGETVVEEVTIADRVFVRQAVPVSDERGELFAGLVMSEEITERKRAEEALRQSEKKFSTIFATIPDMVTIVRLKDAVVLDVNDAWTKHTGYQKSERIGKSGDEINLYVEPELRARQIKQLIETGEINNAEADYRRKDGSLMHGLMSARSIELDGEQC